MTTRVLIDTDPGIDDAVALLYALATPRIEVLGITTVAGNIGLERTTSNARRILALMGREDIPVHAGAAGPLSRSGIEVADIHGMDGLGGVEFPAPGAEAGDDAVAFLVETLMREPASDIVLMVLGPMTNIARLFRENPLAARRVGRIIAMGGAIRDAGNMGPRSEFNMAADPEAADIVLGSGLPIVLIPLDVTRQVRATLDDCARLSAAGTPQAVYSARLIEAYFRSTSASDVSSRPLHDPCVMLMATHRELFRLEAMGLSVDLGTSPDAGALSPESSRMLVLTATEVEGRAAVEHLIAGLS